MLTINSRLKDVYANPVGKDIIDKILLQNNISKKMMSFPLVSALKLSQLSKLTAKILSPQFYDSFLNLLNSEKDNIPQYDGAIEHAWWKEAVFYQIYPRTFCDSNGDGIGDIPGITSKLDYLKELGVDALWLSPVYDSPNDDNGYDIRDYYAILKEFGTMEEFDKLLAEIHKRDMRLIMDLVVNHTSDEHQWFQQALNGSEEYQNYYYFQDHKNNWTSFFSGSAWNYYPECGKYGLHLFSKKQMDLNWENKEVRSKIYDMINWWLDKGVDGFRMDVINYISKQPGLPAGDESIGTMMGFTGIEHYFYGPKLHEYLKEIQEKCFTPHNAFSVGETPGLGMNMAKLVTSSTRKELNMIFSFDHLETPGHTRFEDYQYDLNYFADYMTDWSLNYGSDCWMSIFYNNHDNPKFISKVNPDPQYRNALAKLLCVMQFTLKGTPFMFQGDEMGLVNYNFKNMDDITDVESKGYYQQLLTKGIREKEAFKIILAGTREHGRIMVPFDEQAVKDLPEYLQQKADMDVYDFYRKMIQFRKDNNELIYGDFAVIEKKKNRFIYSRGNQFIIECNLSDQYMKAPPIDGYEVMIQSAGIEALLHPYGVRIYRKKN